VSENLDLVRSLYADWDQGDFSLVDRESEWRETFAPDFEWHTRDDLPDAGVRKGYEGAGRLRDEWVEAFDGMHVELDELIDAGDDVIASRAFVAAFEAAATNSMFRRRRSGTRETVA
jgi:ketosteroid isomerase-like protein